MILGQKLKSYQQRGKYKNVQFDMFDLATLVASAEADDKVFIQNSIKKIIDYQF